VYQWLNLIDTQMSNNQYPRELFLIAAQLSSPHKVEYEVIQFTKLTGNNSDTKKKKKKKKNLNFIVCCVNNSQKF
jgi:hypothetical protein